MSQTPKVSVLIPTYNYGQFLDEAIQSVLAQTFTDYELVIVDNCSTDNTSAVVERYLSDPRITYIRNERNLGLVGNWNKCLDLAKGDYIKMLCADDKFHPQILEKFVAVMEQHPNVMLVTSNNDFFGDKNKTRVRPFEGVVNGHRVRRHILVENGKNWIGEPSAVMFRRSGLAVGRFSSQLVALIDIEYWLRLLTMGNIYVLQESLSYFRWHNAAQTAVVRNMRNERTFEIYRYITLIRQFNQAHQQNDIPEIDEMVRFRASRCAALMYRMLPELHRKSSRIIFKRALEIGRKEKVLFDPVVRLLKGQAKFKVPPPAIPPVTANSASR